MCRPLCQGGLGIQSVRETNRALMNNDYEGSKLSIKLCGEELLLLSMVRNGMVRLVRVVGPLQTHMAMGSGDVSAHGQGCSPVSPSLRSIMVSMFPFGMILGVLLSLYADYFHHVTVWQLVNGRQ